MSQEPGLRERKKQRTRELIAESARRLFVKRGFERVTVAEVARAAEVSEATVFNYFPTKEDLLAVARIIRGSPALQERLTVGWESGAAAITAVTAETSGAGDDDLMPAIVARTLWFTHRSVFLGALTGLVAGEDGAQLASRLRVAADRAYDQLAGGLGEYGRAR